MFFPEKTADGEKVDYGIATAGHLQLVPSGEALSALADDYRRMTEDGLLATSSEPFDVLMDRCSEIALRANTLPNP